MWLAFIILFVIVLAVLGGIVAGGFYAAVLLPIAAVILVGSVLAAMWRRAKDPEARRGHARTFTDPPPMPTGGGSDANATPPARPTPDDLLDARREAS